MNGSTDSSTGDILQSLLVDPEESVNQTTTSSTTPRELVTSRSRSYSTDISSATAGRAILESTVSVQQLSISTAGEQFNSTNSVIGDATSVSFKTTTTKTTLEGDLEPSYSAEDLDTLEEDEVDEPQQQSPRLTREASDPPQKPTTTVEITIGPQHFDLLKLLGTGAFGKVVLVQNRLSKELYAMKVISKKLLRKKNNVQYMKSERQILTKVQHPFLVSLKFAFQSETKLFLVMDFLGGGELFLHLRRRGLILEREVQFYLGEMILAMEFLHQQGIIHRDLKPENVLLRADGHICITDFGLAKEIGDGQATRTLCGTSEYMAPEMLTRTGYGKAVDWWALGALCYEMLVGKPPFIANTQKELDRKIMFEKFTVPSYLTAQAIGLLRGLLEKDPTKRLGCSKGNMFQIGGVTALKQHAFFDSLDWQALAYLDIPPPIDLSQQYYTTPNNNNNNNNNNTANNHNNSNNNTQNNQKHPNKNQAKNNKNTNNNNNTSHANGTMVDEDTIMDSCYGGNDPAAASAAAIVVDTRFFSEEFTTQVLSPSLLEDTFSTHEQTPVRHRSRANSFSSKPKPHPPNQQDSSDKDDNENDHDHDSDDQFRDFEYMSGSFQCTTEQLEAFEAMMKIRTVKEAKKKALRLKREAKQAEEELARRQRLEQEAAAKKQQELKEKQQKEQLKLQQEAAKQEQERQRLLAIAERERVVHNVRVTVYLEEINALTKKLKNVRKKIRDIVDLKERLAKEKKSLDKDQQLKVARLPELEAELADLVEEESELLKKNPGELIPPPAAAVADTATTTSAENPSSADTQNQGKAGGASEGTATTAAAAVVVVQLTATTTTNNTTTTAATAGTNANINGGGSGISGTVGGAVKTGWAIVTTAKPAATATAAAPPPSSSTTTTSSSTTANTNGTTAKTPATAAGDAIAATAGAAGVKKPPATSTAEKWSTVSSTKKKKK